MVNGYLDRAVLKATLGETTGGRDADIDRAIEASSRQIDEWCGDQFWREPTPTPRLFDATDPYRLDVGSFATTTGMVVATDADGDGVFETVWSAADWQAEPLVRLHGRPFRAIVAVSGLRFPVHRHRGSPRRPSAQVTTSWGWPAFPPQVVQACQILSVDHFKSKDLTGGIAGFGELGPVRIAAFNPIARALLDPLRVPLVA